MSARTAADGGGRSGVHDAQGVGGSNPSRPTPATSTYVLPSGASVTLSLRFTVVTPRDAPIVSEWIVTEFHPDCGCPASFDAGRANHVARSDIRVLGQPG